MSQYRTFDQGYRDAHDRLCEEAEKLMLPGPGASVEWNNGWRSYFEGFFNGIAP